MNIPEKNMQKFSGIHFYINIQNYNDILLKEEERTGNVTHALHALDTYFSSVEAYGTRNFPKTLTIEKITGSRLHLYVVDKIDEAYSVVKAVSAYAYQAAAFINKDIYKYQTLSDFKIQIGAAYGQFYNFEFKIADEITELTTIGYAANYGAKLQALTKQNGISISSDIYEAITSEEKENYQKVIDDSLNKYEQNCYYTANLLSISKNTVISDDVLNRIKEYANKVNLSEIEFSTATKPISFKELNRLRCKKITGIPVFADVRGFTSKFSEDDSNLEEMAKKTQDILNTLYTITKNNHGVHVQFQGDRELALYHDFPSMSSDGYKNDGTKCCKTAVLAAMRMIDEIKPYTVHIGVGEDFGRLFVTKIGARGEKDNIVLGRTAVSADQLEDQKAGEDQLAITKNLYEELVIQDKQLASQFSSESDEYYITTVGFEKYERKLTFDKQEIDTKESKYNGAWGDDITTNGRK